MNQGNQEEKQEKRQVLPGRKQEDNQEIQDKNQDNGKRNRRITRNLRKKSGGEPGKSGRETEGEPDTPNPVESDPLTHPDPPVGPNPPTTLDTETNPNPPVQSGNPGGNSGGNQELEIQLQNQEPNWKQLETSSTHIPRKPTSGTSS